MLRDIVRQKFSISPPNPRPLPQAVLEAAGSDMTKVCKTTILLKDMSSFAEVNGIYGEYFSAEAGYPARATYAVAGLPLGALVEIEAVALA